MATRNRSEQSQVKQRPRLQFNDTVEVYFYPENRAQHDHHLSEGDEESLLCEEEQPLTSEEQVEQENADPSFEELLFNFITNQLAPRIADENSSALATPMQRTRRSRASSMNAESPTFKSMMDEGSVAAEEECSDSDKSQSTNENTNLINSNATTQNTSALNSADNCASPCSNYRSKTRTYESSKHEVIDIQGVTTPVQGGKASPKQSASSSLCKQAALKR